MSINAELWTSPERRNAMAAQRAEAMNRHVELETGQGQVHDTRRSSAGPLSWKQTELQSGILEGVRPARLSSSMLCKYPGTHRLAPSYRYSQEALAPIGGVRPGRRGERDGRHSDDEAGV